MTPEAGIVTQWQASHREKGRNDSHITRKRDVCLHTKSFFRKSANIGHEEVAKIKFTSELRLKASKAAAKGVE